MPHSLFSLKNKHIVITGATGLVGSMVAQALAKFGATLTLVGGADTEKLNHLHEKISKNSSQAHYVYSLDMTSRDAVTEFLNALRMSGTPVHGLVHCAMFRPGQKVLNRYKEVFEDSIKANAVGSFLLWDGFSRIMAESSGGSLVYIGSIYGKVSPDFQLYDGTGMGTEPDYLFIKEGMNGLSKYYANKYGRENVRSNVIILGGVFNNQPEIFLKKFTSKIPLARMAEPTDVIGACIYLLSDASKYVTGSEIRVDGGYLSR